MNIKLVLKVLGRVELVVAASMALPLACALLYGEDIAPFLWSIAIILCVSLPLSFLPTHSSFFLREGFATVGLIWLFTGVAGGLPFFFNGGGGFNTIWDCIFEASSGFTTTGATILTDIESLPKGILLWRAFTHWLGGMGILVLATALLPSMGVRSHYLAQAESPGPVFSKLVPKQSQTSKILYSIYCVMTAVEVALLKLAGMPFYDALVHAFSTAGTGGFSNRAASVGAYDSAVIDLIITRYLRVHQLRPVLPGASAPDLGGPEERRAALLPGGGGPGHRSHRGGHPAPVWQHSAEPALLLLPGGLHHLHHRLCHSGLCALAPRHPSIS